MTDKEVGQLWLRACEYTKSHAGLSWAHNCLALIRKLVEERNNNNDDWGLTFEQFGIDPATWKWK